MVSRCCEFTLFGRVCTPNFALVGRARSEHSRTRVDIQVQVHITTLICFFTSLCLVLDLSLLSDLRSPLYLAGSGQPPHIRLAY